MKAILRFEKLRLAIIAIEHAAFIEDQTALEKIARLCDRAFELALISPARFGQSFPLLTVGRDVFLDVCRVQKVVMKGREDLVFNLIQAKLSGIGARPALARHRTGDPDRTSLAVVNCHSAPATAALQEARKWPSGRSGGFSGKLGMRLPHKPLLNCVPQLLADDPQMRYLGVFPGLSRLYSAHALAGDRVENHPHPIPDKDSSVDGVAKDTVAPVGTAVQRRGIPPRPPRSKDTLSVEVVRDLPRGRTFRIVLENPSDHIGLMLLNLKLARFPVDGGIAIGFPAGAETFPDVADHSAMDLLTKILEKHRPHEPAEADLNLVLHTLVCRHDVNIAEAKDFRNLMQITGVAADAVDTFDHDRVETLVSGRF
nr:hypothetical protein [Alloyangia pacifica]